jgi:hypothetical protein
VGTHGKSGPRGNSALTGPDRDEIHGQPLQGWRGGQVGSDPWVATHGYSKATPSGFEGQPGQSKTSGEGEPALRDPTHQATRSAGVSDYAGASTTTWKSEEMPSGEAEQQHGKHHGSHSHIQPITSQRESDGRERHSHHRRGDEK